MAGIVRWVTVAGVPRLVGRKCMGHDDPIQIPEHVTSSNREMFAVSESKRMDSNADAVDAFLVENWSANS